MVRRVHVAPVLWLIAALALAFAGRPITNWATGVRKHRSFAGGLANGSNRREAEVPARLPSWLGLTQSELCQQPGEGCGTLSAES